MNFYLSEIDTLRFGVVTAKCTVNQLSDLSRIEDWCKQHEVVFVIARVRTAEVRLAQKMEDIGFRLMDTLVYFQRDIVGADSSAVLAPSGFSIDWDGRPDVLEMEKTASLVFKNYLGHYHADELLPSAKSDAVYSSWAANSAASEEIANQIIALYSQGPLGKTELAAFATLNYKKSQCEGILFGVHPSYRQRGLHRLLVQAAIFCSAQRGCDSIISSTQLTNLQVQKNWVREGFLPSDSFYTFHYWR